VYEIKEANSSENKEANSSENKEANSSEIKNVNNKMNSAKEQLILRYDLTLPFVRFIGKNNIKSFRGYRYGKVYRRDCPRVTSGRYREFYQCDFDIVGEIFSPMMQETEILNILCSILDEIVGPTTYKVKINSRQILYYILNKFKVPKNLFKTTCSTLDKLDKRSKEDIIEELVEKEIPKEPRENIIKFITYFISNTFNSPYETLKSLQEQELVDNRTLNDFKLLFQYLDGTEILQNIIFDPLLARGLDYYTGLIFEVKYTNSTMMGSSIAAGGRYDNLLGKLVKKSLPAIGLSLGVERLATILEKKGTEITENIPQVYVATVGKNLIGEKIKVCLTLRKNGIVTVMSDKRNPKFGKQMNYVFEKNIPFMVIIGQDELKKNVIKFKDMKKETQQLMPLGECIRTLTDLNIKGDLQKIIN